MPFMYHPDLDTRPGYNPVEVADDEGLLRVMAEAGWGVVEPPEHTDPSKAAVQPDATYVVKNPDPEPPARRGKATKPD